MFILRLSLLFLVRKGENRIYMFEIMLASLGIYLTADIMRMSLESVKNAAMQDSVPKLLSYIQRSKSRMERQKKKK